MAKKDSKKETPETEEIPAQTPEGPEVKAEEVPNVPTNKKFKLLKTITLPESIEGRRAIDTLVILDCVNFSKMTVTKQKRVIKEGKIVTVPTTEDFYKNNFFTVRGYSSSLDGKSVSPEFLSSRSGFISEGFIQATFPKIHSEILKLKELKGKIWSDVISRTEESIS